MIRWWLVGYGLVGALLLGSWLRVSPSVQAGADAPAAPALSGKPLFLQAKDNVAYTLEKAQVRQLGGRAFVVGVELKNSPYQITKEQFGGATVWVPV